MTDVLGRPYAEAVATLRAAGLVVRRMSLTRPPHARVGLGVLRVLQQRSTPEGLHLVVSYENYEDPRA